MHHEFGHKVGDKVTLANGKVITITKAEWSVMFEAPLYFADNGEKYADKLYYKSFNYGDSEIEAKEPPTENLILKEGKYYPKSIAERNGWV